MNKRDELWIRTMKWGNKFGCHQRPERSFSIYGYQFPVCARCLGIILSSLTAYIMFPVKKVSMKICLLLGSIMIVDGLAQYLGIMESTNKRRFVTGCMGGFGLTTIRLVVVHKMCRKIYKQIQKYVRLVKEYS